MSHEIYVYCRKKEDKSLARKVYNSLFQKNEEKKIEAEKLSKIDPTFDHSDGYTFAAQLFFTIAHLNYQEKHSTCDDYNEIYGIVNQVIFPLFSLIM